MSEDGGGHTDPRSVLGPSLLTIFAALALYLPTLSHHYSADSLLYASAIESGSWRALVHPRHPLLRPVAWLWFRWWQLLGWHGAAMVPLQTLNAVGGALCVGLVMALSARMTGSLGGATLAATGFAVSGGVWLLSTEAEFVTVPLAVELLVLAWILRGEASSATRLVGVGSAIAVATLMYLTNAALLPVALLARRNGPFAGRGPAHRTVLLLTGFALPMLPALVGAAFITGLYHWSGMFAGGNPYGIISWENLPRGVYAFLRTLLLFPGLGMNDRTLSYLGGAPMEARAVFAVTYLAVGLTATAPLVLAVWRGLRWPAGREVTVWAALHAAFAFYWVPSDTSFWIPVTAAWWLLVARATATGIVPRTMVAALIMVLLCANALGLILPHHFAPRG